LDRSVEIAGLQELIINHERLESSRPALVIGAAGVGRDGGDETLLKGSPRHTESVDHEDGEGESPALPGFVEDELPVIPGQRAIAGHGLD
jgi:hypothetical protein